MDHRRQGASRGPPSCDIARPDSFVRRKVNFQVRHCSTQVGRKPANLQIVHRSSHEIAAQFDRGEFLAEVSAGAEDA